MKSVSVYPHTQWHQSGAKEAVSFLLGLSFLTLAAWSAAWANTTDGSTGQLGRNAHEHAHQPEKSGPILIKPDHKDLQESDFTTVFREILSAVKEQNVEKLIGLSAPDIMLGFGGSGGHDDLRTLLTDPLTATQYWQSLHAVLALEGVRVGKDVFCVPYPGCTEIDFKEPYSALVVLKRNTPLFRHADLNAKVLRYLDQELVHQTGAEPDVNDSLEQTANHSFIQIVTHDGKTGYVHRRNVRSPIDTRMQVSQGPTGWKIDYIVSGD